MSFNNWRNKVSDKKTKINNKGAISVYLCLVIAVLIPVLLMIIGLAKYMAMQTEVECACNLGTDSLLAEYNRNLLEEYGLLFIDTAYLDKTGSLDKTQAHLQKYLESNLNPDKNLLPLGSRDLFGFKVERAQITRASRATDNDGEVLRYMVDSYMAERYGYGLITDVKDMVESVSSLKLDEIDINKNNDTAQEDIKNFEPPEEEGMEWSEADRDDPVKEVTKIRAGGILKLVTDGDISGTHINVNEYASKRNLVAGDGLAVGKEPKDDLLSLLLFNEYIIKQTGNYRNVKEKGLLSYQTEYIICGKDSDEKNLKEIVNKLILIRGAANTLYYITDVEKQEEAITLASGLAAAVACPFLEPVFKAAIDAGWIYAESVYDVKKLMHGKSVPLITTYDDWDLGLDKAINNTTDAIDQKMKKEENDENNKIGNLLEMKYSDYLRILLYLTKEKDKTMRLTDVIEMDVRQINGNSNFAMDNSISDFTVQIGIGSATGYEYFFEKDCGYY